MQTITIPEVLETWEQGWSQPPVQRALTLLAALYPDESHEELAQCTIGQRNTLLIQARERLFGHWLTSVTACPVCGERLELNFTTADIYAEPVGEEVAATLVLQHAEYEIQFRLPNSLDLAALPPFSDPADIRQWLLQRCLCAAQRAGKSVDTARLPASLLDEVVARMEQADPQANIQLALICPGCGHEWQALFDVLAYLWHELDDWATRTLRDVHRLAAAYGWSEPAILALSPWRRQIYLDLIEQ